jgi:hypothetical protein
VSDLIATLRDGIAAAAAADPQLRRFGASRHRYQLAPPITDRRVLDLLPDDMRAFAAELGGGGAGPYYGCVQLNCAQSISSPSGPAWLPVAHLGCGYAAMVMLEGPARGQIWIDAHAIGVVAPMHASFTALYVDWIDRLAHNRWLDSYVPAGACTLANALSGYLAYSEEQLGIEPGTLAGAQLADALALLGPDAIVMTGGPPLFDDEDPVDPCVRCVQLLDSLGVPIRTVKPGLATRFDRGQRSGTR